LCLHSNTGCQKDGQSHSSLFHLFMSKVNKYLIA
jgi:hypothetical protein